MGFTIQFDKNLVQKERPDEGLEPLQADFLVKREKELLELKTFVNNQNLDPVLEISHNWKGFSLPYGFQTLGTLAKSLEDAAKKEDYDQVNELVFNIEEYLKLKKQLLGS